MILTGLAQLIGLIVIGFVALLAIVTVAVTIHDRIRAWFPGYDLWLYDDVSRWNRRKKRGP
jgi:hypothetical protein